MRYTDLQEKFKPSKAVFGLSDEERKNWIIFLHNWLGGTYMGHVDDQHVGRWTRFRDLFPHGVTAPLPLYRVMTVPYQYADQKTFHIERPAPGAVGSWTSTKIGLDTVAGVANEQIEDNGGTSRIGIGALIQAENIFATFKSLKQGYLSLIHDWEFVDDPVIEKGKDGTYTTTYSSYLGDTSDDNLHMDLGHYQSLFAEMPGGPYRQSEHIVLTTPVDARLIYVYRYRGEYRRDGHDDPHNI